MPAAANVSGLADRYATALFELAQEEGVADAVAGDLAALDRAADENADLRNLVNSPMLDRDTQAKGIVAVAEGLSANALTAKFVGTLAEHRRLYALSSVSEAFRRKLAAARGEVEAEVISAAPLDDGQLNSLKDAVGKSVGTAVALTTKVDPALLGGVVVRIGSRMVDASLRTKIVQLENTLKGIG